jgi:hypothetical protein
MVDIYEQTGLDQSITRPLQEKPIFSKGFRGTSNVPLKPRRPAGTRPVQEIQTQYKMKSATLFVGTDPQVILAGSVSRRYLLIQNIGAVDVWLGFGTTPSAANTIGILLFAGTQLSWENRVVPNNDIQAIANAQAQLSIIEGVAVS